MRGSSLRRVASVVLRQSGLRRLRQLLRRLTIAHRSPFGNLYHCCTQKTASQWFRLVLCDPAVFKYTGLEAYTFAQVEARYFAGDTTLDKFYQQMYHGFPERIEAPKQTVAHLYAGYSTFQAIPKPRNYRAFFVLRDPRDIVVSWYYSARFSHPNFPGLETLRHRLESLNLEDGLKASIDSLLAWGVFDGQASWVAASGNDANARVFRYEDFVKDNYEFLEVLFGYLEIGVPNSVLRELCVRHKFERYSHGRCKGEEDPQSHYRIGLAGDWARLFTSSVSAYFQGATGDLLATLGYER